MIRKIKSRRMRWLVGKSEEKRPLGSPRHRWVYVIKMDLGEVGWGDMWTGLVWLKTDTIGELL
jgi:hypothetical protein